MSLILSPTDSSCRCIAIQGADVIRHTDGGPMQFSDLQQLSGQCDDYLLFEEKHTDICTFGTSFPLTLPCDYERISLRNYFAEYGEIKAAPYFRAKALYEWLYKTRFCTKCGNRLMVKPDSEESALFCPHCMETVFPRIEPCVIMLVNRGDDILLALHRRRNSNYYSCLAGFIEAGESAEEAVRREIMEETGIHVCNIRYFGSQSWPFPSQLMLAFTAEYESGEIHIQESELQRAAWFPRSNCPATPPQGSMAYRLIHNIT